MGHDKVHYYSWCRTPQRSPIDFRERRLSAEDLPGGDGVPRSLVAHSGPVRYKLQRDGTESSGRNRCSSIDYPLPPAGN